MIVLISGATHTGKSTVAHAVMRKYQIPVFSLDLLKMGLIRSKQTDLTPESSVKELTDLLWPITKEIIHTAIENNQSLVIEGCYIPHNLDEHFTIEYLENIKHYCLVFSDDYIRFSKDQIIKFRNIVEKREDTVDFDRIIKENKEYYQAAIDNNQEVIYITKKYDVVKQIFKKLKQSRK